MRSSSGCVTDACARTSAPSRPSTMPSPPSTRPSGSAGRRSSEFVRERHAPIPASTKQTNDRGENYHEGDSGDGSGRGTGRHEAGGAAEPRAAINDVIVQIHASGYVPTETEWPSTWTDRRDRDRTPS